MSQSQKSTFRRKKLKIYFIFAKLKNTTIHNEEVLMSQKK